MDTKGLYRLLQSLVLNKPITDEEILAEREKEQEQQRTKAIENLTAINDQSYIYLDHPWQDEIDLHDTIPELSVDAVREYLDFKDVENLIEEAQNQLKISMEKNVYQWKGKNTKNYLSIFEGLCRGLSNRQMADSMGISRSRAWQIAMDLKNLPALKWLKRELKKHGRR